MQQQNLVPVAMHERIQTIDIIRGFALFGILIINYTVDNQAVTPAEGWTGFGDQVSYWLIRFAMDDRFWAIYCFLFGLGFSLLMIRAKERKSPFVFVYIRRLIVLFLIGTIHEILTDESILHTYAIAGFLLLFIRKLPLKLIPVLALIIFLGHWLKVTIEQVSHQKPVSSRKSTFTGQNDSKALKKYEGVYELPAGEKVIIKLDSGRLRSDAIGGGGPLTRNSQTDFVSFFGAKLTFIDSSGLITGFIIHTDNNQRVVVRRIVMNIEQAQKEMIQQRAVFQERRAREDSAYRASMNSSFVDFIKRNAKLYWNNLTRATWWEDLFWFQIRDALVLFLLGLYAGRRRIFYDISLHRQLLRNVTKWGLLIGVICISAHLGFEAWNFINQKQWNHYPVLTKRSIFLLWELGIDIMALAYVAGLALLLQNNNWKNRLSFLAPVGRMGLTNYILQTIPHILLFQNFGLGLTGKIGCFYRLLLAIPVFILIYFLSRWWLKNFSIGPAEWLWRSLTYLKFQPSRLKPTDTSKENGNI